MMLIPLIAIGLGLALWASSRHQVAHQTAQAHMLAPSPVLASGAPSPLVVLGELLRAGQLPPPFVVACAIAEAEAMGRLDVSSALVEAFVRPVVEAAQAAEVAARIAQARNANPPLMSPVMNPSSPMMSSPIDPSTNPWGPAPQASIPASAYRSPMPPMGGRQKRHPHHAHPHAHHAHHAHAHQAEQGGHGNPFWPAPGIPTAPIMPIAPGMPGMFNGASPMPGDASSLTNIVDPAYGTRVEIVDRPDQRPDRPSPGTARAYAAAQGQGQTPREGTITVSGMNSPIADIPNEAWAEFARRVQRELPTFTTQRHVGQFRQRKDRLADLGFDPESLVSSPDLQHAAFAADMADAYHHASQSGLVQEHQGAVVEIPNTAQGGMAPVQVTLSGVLGVIQAAGLEGAAAWLESPDDRRRFPHTTAAFLRTNGAF